MRMNSIMARKLGPAQPRGVTWNGAGGCVIFSKFRQANFSRTVWITFHESGITSSFSVTSWTGDCCRRLGTITAWRRPRVRAGVIRERLPDRLLALERDDGGRRLRRSSFSGEFVFGRVGFEILKLELELCEQPLGAFGAGTILLAPQLGILQLEMRNHRLGCGLAGAGFGQSRFRFIRPVGRHREKRLKRFDVVRKG